MAIAFDSGTNSTYVSAPTHTFSHTCSGSNRLLIVNCWRRSGSAVTSVTYNGVAMTQNGTEVMSNDTSGQEYISQWYLTNPATGTNNVVVTSSVSTEHLDSAVSYTGVHQTMANLPDASSELSQTTQTNTVATLTTVADNCWAHVHHRNGSGISTAGAGTTRRTNTSGQLQSYDGNSAKTPAGSYSLNITHGNFKTGYKMMSFQPDTYTPPAASDIKSISGIARANIKSMAGLTID